MSLERKDVRAKLRPDVHAAMTVVADADGLDHGEWIERLIEREVMRRVHAATLIAKAAERLGISGKSWESSGSGGSGRE